MFARAFGIFLGGSFEAANRIYGALSGFPVKLLVLQEAAGGALLEAKAGPEVRTTWNLLTSHYQEASNRRNEIAHGQVRHTIWLEGDDPPPGSPEVAHDLGFFLLPRYNNPKKTRPFWIREEAEGVDLGKYKYTHKDLQVLTHRFQGLADWTLEFQQAYVERYPPKG
jgi:hypothetical protein